LVRLATFAVAALLAMTPARADDLVGAYREALDTDPTFAQARAKQAADREQVPIARAGLLPSILLTGDVYEVSQEVTRSGVTNSSNFRNESAQIALTQPLYRRQNFASYRQARFVVEQSQADLAAAGQDLMLRVARAYFDVLLADDTLEFARAETSAVERQLKFAERNFSVGNATIVDVHTARAAFDLAKSQEVEADNQTRVTRERLAAILGRAPGTLAVLRDAPPLAMPEPADIEAWTQIALTDNLSVRAAEYALGAGREDVKRARGGHYPTLDLVGSHGKSKLGGSVFGISSDATVSQIGLELAVPIYSGGATQAGVRQSAARLDQASQALEAARRNAKLGARDAWLAVTNGIARVQALDQAIVSTKKALESTIVGAEAGVRNAVDVLNAQRDYYRARRDLAEARYNYLVSRLQLKAAVGTLSAGDIEATNALLGSAAAPAVQ
jgi:outer membrane protein